MKSSKLCIAYQCPQCGAPAELAETDRLFSCAFCRVKSYLLEGGYFRYHLPHRAPAGRELIYFPYWRFRGMLFAYSPQGVAHRFVDLSHQAIASVHFPGSVGLRSQALKLRFVSPGVPGHFIRPATTAREAAVQVARRFQQEFPSPVVHQAHVGETLSMIYAPFYFNPGLVDGILNSPVESRLTAQSLADELPSGAPDWHIRFLPTLCPGCGWDMQGAPDAHILACGNCQSLWRPAGNRFVRVGFARVIPQDGETVYLPFWRIRAQVNGLALDNYADLVRAANLPRAIQSEWQKSPFRFWAPAFKVRPGVLLRLARALTLASPPAPMDTALPDQGVYTANLPLKEALETMRINLATFLRPVGRVPELLPAIEIKPQKYRLILIPFTERHHDLVNAALQLALTKAHLRMAANL